MSELKPCPFCGGPAGIMKSSGLHQACCADPACPSLGCFETAEEAADIWNTRAAQITPQAGEAEPAYYAVVDEEGDVIELTKDKQYAHDFINDAIASAMEQDITLANRWVVRPLYPTAPARPVGPVKTLDQWHEDFGPVVWFCWDSDNKRWLGEPAWIGTPNDDSWPDYHTHWIPHPPMPMPLPPSPPDSPGATEES